MKTNQHVVQVLQILQIVVIGSLTILFSGCTVSQGETVELMRVNQVTHQAQYMSDIVQISPALTPAPEKVVKVKNKVIIIK